MYSRLLVLHVYRAGAIAVDYSSELCESCCNDNFVANCNIASIFAVSPNVTQNLVTFFVNSSCLKKIWSFRLNQRLNQSLNQWQCHWLNKIN